jgi:arylsulfatase A-like enzyme
MQSILGMVSALDDAVGTVVDTLKQKGLYDNSIILFTTDNGGPSNGFDGNAASNFPLRYKKLKPRSIIFLLFYGGQLY